MRAGPFLLSALLCAGAIIPGACEKRDDTLVQASNDDPRMKSARDEALKRFSEFAAAFEKRKMSDVFLVKTGFPVRNSSDHEYMWISVRRMQGDTISGKLESEPFNDVGLKPGDDVSTTRSAIHDWMYGTKGSKPIGGFQEAVLLEIEKEQPK
ncbi:MAG: DUF2314 domain-containing protein [Phycisphaeraceae bacterium]|nr:DUF2314 domain-containing protein [Phycisphaeraceae bacterium]